MTFLNIGINRMDCLPFDSFPRVLQPGKIAYNEPELSQLITSE